jgi:predicted metal-dependent enzyme (double-stranded beta helix superfamily)
MMLSLPLQDFVRTIEELTARDLSVPELIQRIRPEFARLVAVPDLLQPEHTVCPSGAYAQHILYVDEAGRFCLLALAWQPGARTPVHDHHAWGLAAVYRGHERETRYTWCEEGYGGPKLRPAAVQLVEPGEVLSIVPPSDVHCVANPDPTPSVSLHLYGFDVRQSPSGSSVRTVYGPERLVADAAERAAILT